MPTALVVDDSKAIRMIVCRTLREMGFQVREASDGVAAIESLRQAGPVDLMMADWNMPQMDGLELLKQVRADSSYRAMKVVMVTTENEIGQMATALEAGADEYIMKPFTKEILMDKLRLAALLV